MISEYRSDESLDALDTAITAELGAICSDASAEAFRLKYLGKKGLLSSLRKSVGELTIDERKTVGARINRIASTAEETFKSEFWKASADNAKAASFDPTLPGYPLPKGSIHPSIRTTQEICQIFFDMGFDIAYGPEVETDYYNFEALNFPAHHPARDMQDTFFVTEDRDVLLRTHTSPVQIRLMQEVKRKGSLPIRAIMPGRVYRNETITARSHCTFLQIEGIYIDKNVSLADLKATLVGFAKRLFGEHTAIKIRPSYFPFTEPSIEIDASCFLCKGAGCNVCKHTGWLEILGAGMIHPNVLRAGGIDPDEYSGFAFGMGPDRITMLRYGITDIRLLYENDVRFLRQI